MQRVAVLAVKGAGDRCDGRAEAEVPGKLAVPGTIAAGAAPGAVLSPGAAYRIMTGAPLPAGADAVVMQELCEHDGDTVIVNHLPRVAEAVRLAGSEIARGDVVLAAGCRLRPQQLGLAASVGVAQLPVVRRMRVALFSTGDELVMPGQPLPPGGVYNSNRFQLRALRAIASDQGRDMRHTSQDVLHCAQEHVVRLLRLEPGDGSDHRRIRRNAQGRPLCRSIERGG